MLLPVLVLAAAGAGIYELLKKPKDQPKPQPEPLRGVAPAGATDQPATPSVPSNAPISPPLSNAPSNPMMPQGPQVNPVSPITPAPSAKAAEVTVYVAAQQPQPTDPNQAQPPLPPAPATGITTQTAIVATNGTPGTNDSRLRVRSGPSTLAAVVPGGDPINGGGIPKGATVTVTGPTQAQMTPITYGGLVGWVYSGYLRAS
jgi:hypothetical protein